MPDHLELHKPTSASQRCLDLFSQAMLELVCMSEVAAANVGNETAHLKPTSSAPKGSNGALISSFDRRWKRCTCEYDRLLVIKDAQQAVRDARYAPPKAKIRGTAEWKRAIAIDQRTSMEIAEQYGVSSSYVRTIKGRFQAGEL